MVADFAGPSPGRATDAHLSRPSIAGPAASPGSGASRLVRWSGRARVPADGPAASRLPHITPWKVRMSDDTALSPLDAPGIDAAVEAALKALDAASDLDALKTARLEHVGERSPIALANRGIGGLAPADKATAGKLLGQAKARLGRGARRRQAELEAERDAARPRRGDRRRHAAHATATRAAPGTRWRRCPSGSPTSSSRWAGRSPRVPSSSPSGSTSTR